jgi:hypothetical protein
MKMAHAKFFSLPLMPADNKFVSGRWYRMVNVSNNIGWVFEETRSGIACAQQVAIIESLSDEK